MRVVMPNETLNVDVVGGGSLGTVESDEFGYVPGDTFASGVTAGQVVVFSHDTHPGTLRRTIASTPEGAEVLRENITPVLILDYEVEEQEATKVALWLRDMDNPEVADVFLGYGVPGQDNWYQVPNFQTRNLRVFGNPMTDEGQSRDLLYEDAQSADLTAGSASEASTHSIVFSESVGASSIINVYSVAGTEKARKACAVDSFKPACAFVKTAVLAGAAARIYFSGNIISGLSGLTPGLPIYLSTTAGEVTHTRPRFGQLLGYALSTSTAIFTPHPMKGPILVSEDTGLILLNEDLSTILMAEE